MEPAERDQGELRARRGSFFPSTRRERLKLTWRATERLILRREANRCGKPALGTEDKGNAAQRRFWSRTTGA